MRFRSAGRNPWTFPWQKKRNRRIDDAAMKIARGLEPAATQPSAPYDSPGFEYDHFTELLKVAVRRQPRSSASIDASHLMWAHPALVPVAHPAPRGSALWPSAPVDPLWHGQLMAEPFKAYLTLGRTVYLDLGPKPRTSKAPEDSPEWARDSGQNADR